VATPAVAAPGISPSAPAALATPAPAPATVTIVPQTSSDPSRSLLEQKTRELGGTEPPPSQMKSAATASTKGAPSSHSVVPFIPVTTPAVASPLPQNKQQRLADLLESYRMNLITPTDYHSARAKILAEP
jgi:hypothetical protein